MVITPQTEIRLIKSPIELDNKNQLTFSSKQAQETYFKSLPYLEANDYTYQRKDGFIRFEAPYDSLLEYNYCMYKNEAYSNKWFYAFITDFKMLNNDVTAVFIKTDVWQTWMFDLEFKNSFIEREHVNDDTFGLNLVPENVELGEYTCNSHTLDEHYDNVNNDVSYVMSTSVDYWAGTVADKYRPATPRKYNGIVNGTNYSSFDDETAIKRTLADLEDRGQIEAVNGLFIAPNSLLPINQTYAGANEIASSTTPVSYNNNVSKQSTLDTYTPKNKKLLTYPYNYLLVSNNNGDSAIYRYEEFSTSNCQFVVEACLTPGCSIRQVPLNYKNMSRFDEYGLNLGKFPICSYPVDMYTNWLTQNSVNVPGIGKVSGDELNLFSNIVGSTLGALGGAIAGNYLSSANYLSSGFTGISNALIQKQQHELIPPESR